MNKTIVKVLTAAALISGAAVISQPASAMGFKNCTGHQIRIKIYNNRDTARLVAKRNRTFGVNDYYSFNLDSKLYQAQVYISRPGADQKAVLRGGLKGTHKFSVRRSGSRYYISDENDCGSAGVKPPVVSYIPVSEGWWNGANKPIVIRQVTRNSFKLGQKNKNRRVQYNRVRDNTYRGEDGGVFIMRGNGVADWNGIRVRVRR